MYIYIYILKEQRREDHWGGAPPVPSLQRPHWRPPSNRRGRRREGTGGELPLSVFLPLFFFLLNL